MQNYTNIERVRFTQYTIEVIFFLFTGSHENITTKRFDLARDTSLPLASRNEENDVDT